MADGNKPIQAPQVEYYVSKGEQTLGPWTIDEIADRLAHGEIAVTDFIYEDAKGDWVPLLECAAMRERLQRAKPKAPPPPKAAQKPAPVAQAEPIKAAEPAAAPAVQAVEPAAETPASSEALSRAFSARREKPEHRAPSLAEGSIENHPEWFVQKGNNRYGPFTYLGVVRALQEKTIYEFDYIWKNGMDQWVRVAEHEEFSTERVRQLRLNPTCEPGVFQERRHPRVAFESEAIVHDNRSVWTARSHEGSVGGSGLIIENATLIPGQVVLVHFASHDGLPAFNVLCEIVSKRYTKEIRDESSPVYYGVRFVELENEAETRLKDFVQKRKSSAKHDSSRGSAGNIGA